MLRLKLRICTNRKRIIICSIIAVIILISLFFSNKIEILLSFKPNLKPIQAENDLEIHYLDIGQADCTLIRLPNDETVIIDTGISSKQKTLKTYLDKIFLKKNKTINHLILTHSDSDHTGNTNFLIDHYNVLNVYIPHESITNLLDIENEEDKEYFDILNKINQNEKGINVITNLDNVEIKNNITGEVYLDWLYPNTEINSTTNDYSPIIEIGFKERYTLFCGDVSIEAENICILNNIMKDVDVLKVAHHGSDKSTGEVFLETINPEYAIISVGKNNVYDFPASNLLNRLYNYNINLYNNIMRTDKNGNIIQLVDSDGNLKFHFVKDMDYYSFSKWYMPVIVFLIVDFFVAINLKRVKKKKSY